MSDTESSQSEDGEQPMNFIEISTTAMGETNVKYCATKFLGKGRSAIVYPGYHFGIIKPAAVKFIEKKYLRLNEEHINELKIWSNVDESIHIIRLYDSYRVKREGMFLAMELAERTFREQINDHNPDRDDVVKWLYQVASAVEYLHEKGVIHRDIKPDNILMVLKDGNKIIAKLGDFGVSKMLSNAERSGTFSNANGTVLWMPPEAITNQSGKFKNTRMLDIYCLGMVIYFGLSLGGHPFSKSDDDDLSKVLSHMTSETAKPFELEINEVAANDLISKMLQRLPENRPNISEVLTHCLFWNLEQEQLFLIRTAICLSKKDCDVIQNIKNEIDQIYSEYYQSLNRSQSFNWLNIAKESQNINIRNLFFEIAGRKKLTVEYGNGESVTKFLKFFRDKYVHYPDMKPEATIEFSDKDGIFCEEKYVEILTSICPGISAIIYKILQTYANEPNVMPLSKVYFRWKISKSDNPAPHTTKMTLVEKVSEEKEKMQENVERIGNSDIYFFKDTFITDNIRRGYYRRPSTPAAIKTRKLSSTEAENYSSRRSAWSEIWLVESRERTKYLLSAYCLVEQYQVLHIAMEMASSSLYLEITNGNISMPKDVNQVSSYLHNIAEAVDWLHKKSVPHRKISPKTVLIFGLGKKGKIAKLGLSDPCNFDIDCVSDYRELVVDLSSFGKYEDKEKDIESFGKVVKFSIYGKNQQIVLNSSKMFVANNLVNWLTQELNKPMISQVLGHPLFWDDDKCLQFICDFSSVLRSTMIKWEANMINPKNSSYFYSETSKDPYTWVEKVDSRLIEGFTTKNDKSFPSLVELIEKIALMQSEQLETLKIDDDVMKELFYGESNTFCRKKLFEYFTERFPELLILCFCGTVKFQLNSWPLLHKYVGQLGEKRFDKIPTVIE